jgi:hypothetical protein
VQDLHDGDLIIWKMSDEASHVEMFVKSKNLFEQTSIHAVNNPAKKMTRVMATSFQPQFYKHVFHCKKRLRLKASLYAERWAAYENRYDTDRINVKTAFRELHRNLGTSKGDLQELMKQLFMERGRFRAIKYTARRRGILCYPGDQEGDGGRGMTCCMYAILCYQVAGLADHVKPLEGSPFGHVSDKKLTEQDATVVAKKLDEAGFSKQAIGDYMSYVGSIQQQNEYGIDWKKSGKPEVVKGKPQSKRPGYLYVPSLLQWETPKSFSGFDWAAALTPGMLLDAKIANPEHVWQSLQADSENWDYAGSMAHPAPDAPGPTEEAKKLYQQTLSERQQTATKLRQTVAPK